MTVTIEKIILSIYAVTIPKNVAILREAYKIPLYQKHVYTSYTEEATIPRTDPTTVELAILTISAITFPFA